MESMKIISASDNDELLTYFRDKGFNIKSEWKKLGNNDKEQRKIMEEILAELKLLINSNGIKKHIQTGNINDVCIVKIRIRNLKQKSGKSSGYRTYSLIISNQNLAILFDIYPKNGSNGKDNISDTEKNKMKQIVNYFKN